MKSLPAPIVSAIDRPLTKRRNTFGARCYWIVTCKLPPCSDASDIQHLIVAVAETQVKHKTSKIAPPPAEFPAAKPAAILCRLRAVIFLDGKIEDLVYME
ncbi:MAG: hypothetical protein CEE38_15595 [Planctomycetes bacterium B3_Pla]|nr:MAG: hypothetical protein CEE38_15595 [Planctomycetes bacterium B3_Pla]